MSLFRRVIRIRASDSPNVRLAEAEIAAGLSPSHRELVPGVLSYREYQKRRQTWDEVRQAIGLDGTFWEGKDVLLYPPHWLNLAEERADALQGQARRAKAMGCDPAEGGDRSCWSIIDEYGLIEMVSILTPNTTHCAHQTLALMQEFGVPAERVAFDRGGGGKQHADWLRERGHDVRTVAFGESVSLEIKRGIHKISDRIEVQEQQYTYLNRRAEMYHALRLLLDPDLIAEGPRFAIPARFAALRQQMAKIPLLFDPEGRIRLLSKQSTTPDGPSLVKLIGHSPDELDSLVLGVHALTHAPKRSKAGVF